MDIIRYSLNGFKSQFQKHHLRNINYYLFNFTEENHPGYLLDMALEKRDRLRLFYIDNYEDLSFGVWAFINGYKNNQSLNHLKRKVPCWKAEISDDTVVYDVNWDKKMKITSHECKIFGFYIPSSQLNTLVNIRRCGKS